VRELTPGMKKVLKVRCLFCDGEKFYLGPQGGWSRNIYCANEACLAGFNVTVEELPWQLIADPEEHTLAQLRQILRFPAVSVALIHQSIRDELADHLDPPWAPPPPPKPH
jgi:hypothetical protein